MGVRAEVVRQVPFDVSQLTIDAEQQIDDPRLDPEVVRVDEELQRPNPGQRSKRELEHARPVDPDQRWICLHPARQFGNEPIAVFRLAGQPPGAAEHHPVLMPIQSPDDLVVAADMVKKRNGGPESLWRAAIVNRVVVPGRKGGGPDRRGRGGKGKAEARIAKQIVLARDNPIGARRCLWRAFWKRGANATSKRLLHRRVNYEALRFGAEVRRQTALRVAPSAGGKRPVNGRELRRPR